MKITIFCSDICFRGRLSYVLHALIFLRENEMEPHRKFLIVQIHAFHDHSVKCLFLLDIGLLLRMKQDRDFQHVFVLCDINRLGETVVSHESQIKESAVGVTTSFVVFHVEIFVRGVTSSCACKWCTHCRLTH